MNSLSETKNQPKEEVSAGHPCRHLPKNFGQSLQILEKKQAFWHGNVARTSTKKLRPEKLRADFPSLALRGILFHFWAWVSFALQGWFRLRRWGLTLLRLCRRGRVSRKGRATQTDKQTHTRTRTHTHTSNEGYWGRSKRGRGKRHNTCAIASKNWGYVFEIPSRGEK